MINADKDYIINIRDISNRAADAFGCSAKVTTDLNALVNGSNVCIQFVIDNMHGIDSERIKV